MTTDIVTGVLALGPWHGFDLDAAGGAIHAAHGVGERDGNVPDRDELELSGPGHAVVSGTGFAATRASGFAVGPWNDFADNACLVSLSTHSDGMVNEALEAADFVEQALELNRWGAGCYVVSNRLCQPPPVRQCVIPPGSHLAKDGR